VIFLNKTFKNIHNPASMTQLPIMRENTNPMRKGLGDTAAFKAPIHPAQEREITFHTTQAEFKKLALDNLYGTHMAARLQIEQGFLSEFQRLPSLQTSFVGLETMMGIDEDLGFSDYLGDPSVSEYNVDIHHIMETKLGL